MNAFPFAGDMYTATVHYWLADGSRAVVDQNVILYDVVQIDVGDDYADAALTSGGCWRVLWSRMVTDRSGTLPEMSPAWSLVWGNGQPAPRALVASHPQLVTSRAVELRLNTHTGIYQPRDPQANAIEILRDGAHRALAAAEPTDRELAALAADSSMAAATATEKLTALHVGIRAALARKMSPSAIAAAVKMTPGRIYQIRDGRR